MEFDLVSGVNLELMNDKMELKDDKIIYRPTTPPNILSSNVFSNDSPSGVQSPLKGLKKLVIGSSIPFKRLEFDDSPTKQWFDDGMPTSTSTPSRSPAKICKKRNISTCPLIRNKFRQVGGFRHLSTEHVKPKTIKTILMEYINPFTPDGRVIATKKVQNSNISDPSIQKFFLNDTSNSDEFNNSASLIKPKLYELNVVRYNQEFVELEEIGRGVHGSVYKCLNRMNGCIYAIKKTNKEIVNTSFERIVRNEVYAHGILEHPNLVRNYSSWTENGFVYMQNEYCNSGCLTDFAENHILTESDARALLYQIGIGLCYIHEKGLAHMDVKPDNIFLHESGKAEKFTNNCLASTSSPTTDGPKELIFKLGDFGHIVPLDGMSVEDGDCRYLSKEVLQDNYAHLDKADIFSLGLTIYEVISRQPLPKNGDEWQRIREDGYLRHLPNYSAELNELLKDMIKPDPTARPSAGTICEMLTPAKSSKLDQDLFGYLQQINNNVNVLQHKVDDMIKPDPTARPSAGTICEMLTPAKSSKCVQDLFGYLQQINNNVNILQHKVDDMIKPDPTARPSAGTICEMLTPAKSSKCVQDLFGYLQQINNNVNVLQHKVDFSGRYSKMMCRFISDKWGTSMKRSSVKRTTSRWKETAAFKQYNYILT